MTPAEHALWANKIQRECLIEAGNDVEAGRIAAEYIIAALSTEFRESEHKRDDGGKFTSGGGGEGGDKSSTSTRHSVSSSRVTHEQVREAAGGGNELITAEDGLHEGISDKDAKKVALFRKRKLDPRDNDTDDLFTPGEIIYVIGEDRQPMLTHRAYYVKTVIRQGGPRVYTHAPGRGTTAFVPWDEDTEFVSVGQIRKKLAEPVEQPDWRPTETLPEDYYLSHDIANRRAQGLLNQSLKGAKGLSADARKDLEDALKDPTTSGQAILDFINKYRLQLTELIQTTIIAATLEGAQDIATKVPQIDADAEELGLIPTPTFGTPVGIQLSVLGDLVGWVWGAAKRLAGKNVLTRHGYDTLDAQARAKAITVAGVDAEETLTKIRDALAENVRQGADHETFRASVLADVGEGTFLSPAHLETVFRTNVQSAFSDGQMSVLQNPLVRSGFPYSAYDSIHDDRARPHHNALDTSGIGGTNVYRNDDPVFQMFRPPWDYNCRCSWTPLTVRQAAEAGVAEARQWLATGIPPAEPTYVPMPPFTPPPGFVRAAASAPLSVRLSLQPAAAFATDFDEQKHKRDEGGKFTSGGGSGGGKAKPKPKKKRVELYDIRRAIHGSRPRNNTEDRETSAKQIGRVYRRAIKVAKSAVAKVRDIEHTAAQVKRFTARVADKITNALSKVGSIPSSVIEGVTAGLKAIDSKINDLVGDKPTISKSAEAIKNILTKHSAPIGKVKLQGMSTEEDATGIQIGDVTISWETSNDTNGGLPMTHAINIIDRLVQSDSLTPHKLKSLKNIHITANPVSGRGVHGSGVVEGYDDRYEEVSRVYGVANRGKPFSIGEESNHYPRNNSNQFISKHIITEAARDPNTAAGLRESLPEEERPKLDRVIAHLLSGGTVHHPSEQPGLGVDITGNISDPRWATYAFLKEQREAWEKRNNDRTERRSTAESITKDMRDPNAATKLYKTITGTHDKVTELSVADLRKQFADVIDSLVTYIDNTESAVSKTAAGAKLRALARTRHAAHADTLRHVEAYIAQAKRATRADATDADKDRLSERLDTLVAAVVDTHRCIIDVLEDVLESIHATIDEEHEKDKEPEIPKEPEDEPTAPAFSTDDFDESKHKRDEGGKFTSGGKGSPENSDEDKGRKTTQDDHGEDKSAPARTAPRKSKAKVNLGMWPFNRKVKRHLRDLLGSDNKELCASIVGAPDNATVTVSYGSSSFDYERKGILISVKSKDYQSERVLYREPEGKGERLVMYCDWALLNKNARSQGAGAEIFINQVENCQAAGIDALKCHAAGSATRMDGDSALNGFYTWARFGYDQSLTDSRIEEISEDVEIYKAARKAFPEAKTVLDIMSTKEGREWWKSNGTNMINAQFNLRPGSRSMKILEAYKKEISSRKSSSTTSKTQHSTQPGTASSESRPPTRRSEPSHALGMSDDGTWHGPNPPGDGWTPAQPGPRGGKRWRKADTGDTDDRRTSTDRGTGIGAGGRQDAGRPDTDGKRMEGAAEGPVDSRDGKVGKGAGKSTGTQAPGYTSTKAKLSPADRKRLERVNQRIDKYRDIFRRRGQTEAVDWLDVVRDHINNIGIDHAINALGEANGTTPQSAATIQYRSTTAFDDSPDSRFLKRYLDHAGIIVQQFDATRVPGKKLITAAPVPSATAQKKRGDIVATETNLASKLEESKHLPGLESTEDIDKIMGIDSKSNSSNVTQRFTPDVINALDERYGKDKWIVKSYGDESYGGFGIFFPQRVRAIHQSSVDTIQATQKKLARYGFELDRNENNRVVGLRDANGNHYRFGTPEYSGIKSKVVRRYGRTARAAASSEFGTRLPISPEKSLEQDYGILIHRDKQGEVSGITTPDGQKIPITLKKGDDGTVWGVADSPEYNKFKATLDDFNDEAVTKDIDRAVAAVYNPGQTVRFMAQPAFEAVGVTEAERAMGLTWETSHEGRVHVAIKNGKASVVPYATLAGRGDALPVVFANDDIRAMERAAQEAIDALPETERMGQVYAPDVVKTKDGWRVVEVNASSTEGSSLWLEENPFVIDAYVSHVTDREPAHVGFIRNTIASEIGLTKLWPGADKHTKVDTKPTTSTKGKTGKLAPPATPDTP